MYYVYVLFSNKLNKRYAGSTSNVKRRLLEHNGGRSKFTKGGIPWNLIYSEEFETNSEARKKRAISEERRWQVISRWTAMIEIRRAGSAPEAHQPSAESPAFGTETITQ
jgi:putative endonuclease